MAKGPIKIVVFMNLLSVTCQKYFSSSFFDILLPGKNGKHYRTSKVTPEQAAQLKLFGAASMNFQHPNSTPAPSEEIPPAANLKQGPEEEEDEDDSLWSSESAGDDSDDDEDSDDDSDDDCSMDGQQEDNSGGNVFEFEMTNKSPDFPQCVTLNASKSDLHRSCFLANPNACYFNGRNYALASLLLPSVYDDSNTMITISSNGRKCMIDLKRNRESFEPSRVIGFGLPSDHAAAAAMDLYVKKIQGHHESNSITGRITLRIPFCAEPHTSNDLLKATDGTGKLLEYGIRMPMVRFRSDRPDSRNFTRILVICFKERDDGFQSNKKIKEHEITGPSTNSASSSSAHTSNSAKKHKRKTNSSSNGTQQAQAGNVVEEVSDKEMQNVL